MEESLAETTHFLHSHLESSGVSPTPTWTLSQSPIGGRGLFALRDLYPGDLVLVDAPLVTGPVSSDASAAFCVVCYTSGARLTACSRGCGLPVCGKECEGEGRHRGECERLRRWQARTRRSDATSWSPGIFRCLTPVRCLGLQKDQRQFLRCLEAHSGPLHEHEVELLKQHLEKGPTAEEEELLRFCCRALDANSFEISAQLGTSSDGRSTKTILRGMFPVGAMLNHSCTSNTRHGFDKDLRMHVRATVLIPRGTEITTSYFAPLWGTSARRHHLHKTRHFYCFCSRCRDPQESGTRLSALKCPNRPCSGSLLCEDPVQSSSKWACDKCDLRLSERQARCLHAGLGSMLRAINCDDPAHVAAFLRGHQVMFASTNQAVVEMKSCLVWSYGHKPGYLYEDLSASDVLCKETLCRELLRLLQLLKAGQCRLRGLLLFELHCTLVEKQRRCSVKCKQADGEEASQVIDEVASIFNDDVTAPSDLWLRLRDAKNTNMDIIEP